MKEVVHNLAAFYFYGTPQGKEKGASFEKLPEEEKKPFKDLVKTLLVGLDKLGMVAVPYSEYAVTSERRREIENRIADQVRIFFAGITVWKKGMIPTEELVAQMIALFHELKIIIPQK